MPPPPTSLDLEYVYIENAHKVVIKSTLTTPSSNNYAGTVQVDSKYNQEHNYQASGQLVNTNNADILTNVIMPKEADTDAKKIAVVKSQIEKDLNSAGRVEYTISCNYVESDGSKGKTTSTISKAGSVIIT